MNASRWLLTPVLILAVVGSVTAQGKLPKTDSKTMNVRTWTECNSSMRGLVGVVDMVDEKGMTVTDPNASPPKQHILAPVDLLAQGKRLKDADGGLSYLWQDVKKGDAVHLWAAFDDGEQKWYCLAICITRRPGAKLPESQDIKKDWRHARDSLLNDIENGLDVSEADIAKQFPPRFDPRTHALEKPGGLPGEYRGKLNAIRDKLDAEKAKKEKELKATPPDKK